MRQGCCKIAPGGGGHGGTCTVAAPRRRGTDDSIFRSSSSRWTGPRCSQATTSGRSAPAPLSPVLAPATEKQAWARQQCPEAPVVKRSMKRAAGQGWAVTLVMAPGGALVLLHVQAPGRPGVTQRPVPAVAVVPPQRPAVAQPRPLTPPHPLHHRRCTSPSLALSPLHASPLLPSSDSSSTATALQVQANL